MTSRPYLPKDLSRLREGEIVRRGRGCGPLYFRADLVRPGDLLLTGGSRKTPRAVARFTNGPFSHAALVVDGNRLLESDHLGIGYGHVPIRWEKTSGPQRQLCELKSARCATVLRHPDLEHYPPEDTRARIKAAATAWIYKEYPELSSLLETLPQKSAIRLLASRIFAYWDRKYPRANPGPFCSELIALIFEGIGLELMTDGSSPRNIDPNRIFFASRLVPVPNVICFHNLNAEVAERDDEEAEMRRRLDALGSREVLTRLAVEGHRELAIVQRKVEELLRIAEEYHAIDLDGDDAVERMLYILGELEARQR